MTGSLTKLAIFIFLAIFIVVVYHFATFKFDYMGYQNKIWAHRVNSIEKLQFTQHRYSGIELDLVFDEKTRTFDVNHPPVASIGLTLDSFFSHYDSKNQGGIWLDFKNLKAENSDSSLKRLLKLVQKYNLDKGKIIVESQSPQFLESFENAGFKTSYYLPVFLHQLSEEYLNIKLSEIEQNIENNPTTAISTNIVDYEIIAKHFPNHTKYLWSIDKTFTSRIFKNYFRNRKALKDPNVEVLLVRVNRQVGNR
jgi:hypothetical protein